MTTRFKSQYSEHDAALSAPGGTFAFGVPETGMHVTR